MNKSGVLESAVSVSIMATGGESLNIGAESQIVQCAECWKHLLPGVSMGNIVQCSDVQLKAQITCMYFQIRRMLDMQVHCLHYIREVVQIMSLIANEANYTDEGMGRLRNLSKHVGWIIAKDGGWVHMGGVFAEFCRLIQCMILRDTRLGQKFLFDIRMAMENQLAVLIRNVDMGALCLYCSKHCGHHEGHELAKVYGKVKRISIKGHESVLRVLDFHDVHSRSARVFSSFQKSDFGNLLF